MWRRQDQLQRMISFEVIDMSHVFFQGASLVVSPCCCFVHSFSHKLHLFTLKRGMILKCFFKYPSNMDLDNPLWTKPGFLCLSWCFWTVPAEKICPYVSVLIASLTSKEDPICQIVVILKPECMQNLTRGFPKIQKTFPQVPSHSH